jgi:isopentenyl diphosphate isomerase/L-lactate dehydrogenase-like FMN-dependent dehydrogenase
MNMREGLAPSPTTRESAITDLATDSVADRFLALHEFVPAARMKLSDDKWDYMIGGAETETTLKRNRLALDSLGFCPRVLRDVSDIDCSGSLFGQKLRLPVMLAPVGSIQRFDPAGSAAVARAAGAFGVPQMVSSVSEPSLEETAAAAKGPKIYQLYVRGNDEWVEDIIDRAAAAGYDGFAFTVDVALYSRRERDISKRALMRSAADATAQRYQAALSWPQIKRFRQRCKLPLIIKGIQTAQDAIIACDHGVDGIYVTNHGGRQLDHGRGTIDILRDVVSAVGGRTQIIVDGGFCRGTDIIKGIALGANVVSIGRLYLYGLAAAGQAGVHRVLELLETEIRIGLGLLGVTSFAELDKSCLQAVQPVNTPHVFSAFPLLEITEQLRGKY